MIPIPYTEGPGTDCAKCKKFRLYRQADHSVLPGHLLPRKILPNSNKSRWLANADGRGRSCRCAPRPSLDYSPPMCRPRARRLTEVLRSPAVALKLVGKFHRPRSGGADLHRRCSQRSLCEHWLCSRVCRYAAPADARLPRPPEPRAARGRRDRRRPPAGAGRRRHRQDPRADHPLRPHPADRPRLPRPGPGGHLHQQGRPRDARTGRRHPRPPGRGPVARHVPRPVRPHAAPARRPGRAVAKLHHPRHRRPAPPAEAGDGGRAGRHQALGAARADGGDPALEGSRPDAGPGHRRPRTPISPPAAPASSMPPTRRGCAR